MNRWRDFLLQRSRRERWGLAIAAVCLLLAIAYVFVWQPLAGARQRLNQRMPGLEIALQEMRAFAAELPRLTPRQPGTGPMNREELALRAKKHGLSVALGAESAVSPTRLAFHLPGASFPAVLGLLEDLRQESGWLVMELKLARVAAQTVNADVVLARP